MLYIYLGIMHTCTWATSKFASFSLCFNCMQAMQDSAIQSRTEMRLNADLEQMKQKLTDFKLEKEQARTKLRKPTTLPFEKIFTQVSLHKEMYSNNLDSVLSILYHVTKVNYR